MEVRCSCGKLLCKRLTPTMYEIVSGKQEVTVCNPELLRIVCRKCTRKHEFGTAVDSMASIMV